MDKCCLRTFDADDRELTAGWRIIEEEVPCYRDCYNCSAITYKAFMKICDFDALKHAGGIVGYPEVVLADECRNEKELRENVLAGHQWFTANFDPLGRKFSDSLPEILDPKPGLEKREVYDICPRDREKKNPYFQKGK